MVTHTPLTWSHCPNSKSATCWLSVLVICYFEDMRPVTRKGAPLAINCISQKTECPERWFSCASVQARPLGRINIQFSSKLILGLFYDKQEHLRHKAQGRAPLAGLEVQASQKDWLFQSVLSQISYSFSFFLSFLFKNYFS